MSAIEILRRNWWEVVGYASSAIREVLAQFMAQLVNVILYLNGRPQKLGYSLVSLQMYKSNHVRCHEMKGATAHHSSAVLVVATKAMPLVSVNFFFFFRWKCA